MKAVGSGFGAKGLGAEGFSMIELMIATSILGVAIIGTVGALGLNAQLVAVSREDTLARQAAERQMADLRGLSQAQLDSQPSTFIPDLGPQGDQVLLPAQDDTPMGRLSVAADATYAALRVVTVRITWHSPALQKQRTLLLHTKMGDR